MAARYTLYLYDPLGNRLATLDRFLALTYTLSVNMVGTLDVTLPGDFDSTLLGEDYRIEVWRSIDGQNDYLEADQQWFIRRIIKQFPVDQPVVYLVRAVSALDILRRRIIAYNSGSSFALKIAPADSAIVSFVSENLTAINTTYRDPRAGGSGQTLGTDLSAYITVAPASNTGSNITKAAARDNLLQTCQDIANISAQNGLYLAFDLIWNGTMFVFQTYLQQRSTDRRFPGSTNPVLLSPSFGSFADITYTRDWSDELTVAIGGGQGEGTERLIAVHLDATRVVSSPFNRVEQLIVANQGGTSASVVGNAAIGAVRAGRPKVRFTGRIQQTSGVQYGRDWFWGDYLTASDDSASIDSRIDAVTITFAHGEETIEAWLRGDV